MRDERRGLCDFLGAGGGRVCVRRGARDGRAQGGAGGGGQDVDVRGRLQGPCAGGGGRQRGGDGVCGGGDGVCGGRGEQRGADAGAQGHGGAVRDREHVLYAGARRGIGIRDWESRLGRGDARGAGADGGAGVGVGLRGELQHLLEGGWE